MNRVSEAKIFALISALSMPFILFSCKGVTSEQLSERSNTKSLSISEDGIGAVGLVDLSFAKADRSQCPNGGLLYRVYSDINSSGADARIGIPMMKEEHSTHTNLKHNEKWLY